MPQAPSWLQDKFPGYDAEALEVIKSNYIVDKGFVIKPRLKGYKATERENEALDYLFLEWDFGFEDCI